MNSKAFNKAMGAVIRKERKLRGWSMEVLGQQLGFSYQQIQKYESGVNGFSAQLLVIVAKVLQIPVVDLYERAGLDIAVTPADPSPAEADGILAARYVSRITDKKTRQIIIDMSRKFAYEGNAA